MPPQNSTPNSDLDASLSALLPTEDNHFKAYRAPWIGLTTLFVGLLNLLWAIWIILTAGKFNSAIITGVAITTAGYLYLTRPYFVLAPNRLTVYNLIGSVVKRYPFTRYNNLHTDDQRLYIEDIHSHTTRPTAKKQPVKISKWLTKSTDWNQLKDIITVAISVP